MALRNNPFVSDVAVETVPIQVGSGDDFSISFFHFYWLEENFDGGVVEISVDGGDWVDVTEAGGSFDVGYVAPLVAQALQVLSDRMAFTGINGDLITSVGNRETISFGNALNGRTVRLRFRIATDKNTAEVGWLIDNVSFTNIASSPFSRVIAGDSVSCDNSPPKLNLPASELIAWEGVANAIFATVTDRNPGDFISYNWEQTAGPATALSGTDTDTLIFRPAAEPADTELGFRLTVDDGSESVSADVVVTVDGPPPPRYSLGREDSQRQIEKDRKTP